MLAGRPPRLRFSLGIESLIPTRLVTARGWLRQHLPASVAFALGLVFVWSRIVELAATSAMPFDFVSYVLPASSFSTGLGKPYVNYWDIKPPLLLAHLALWIEFFGLSLKGFYVLYALWLILTLVCAWLLLRVLVPPWIAAVAFAGATVAMSASGSLDMFFPSELPGLAIVLLGLLIVVKWSNRDWSPLVAAALLTAAGQFKDVYTLAPAVLVPVIWCARSRVKTALYVVIGAVTSLGLTALYLVVSGSLGGYLSVLAWKHSAFPAPGVTGELRGVGKLLFAHNVGLAVGLGSSLFAVVIALVLQRRVPISPARGASGRQPRPAALVLLLWLLLAVGFVWQGKSTSQHYLVTVQLPSVLAVAAAFSIAAEVPTTSRRRNIALAALTIVCFFPQQALARTYVSDAWNSSPHRLHERWSALESPAAVAEFRRPGSLTPTGRCIQVAYGWWDAAFYLYSRRPSCSRYFLPPLVTTPKQIAQLRAQIAGHAPAVVVYQTAGADTDISTYEKNVFPWTAVLAACYSHRGGEIYVARSTRPAAVSSCIARTLAAAT